MVCEKLVDTAPAVDRTPAGDGSSGKEPHLAPSSPAQTGPSAPPARARRNDETPMTTTEQAPSQAGPRILLVEDEPQDPRLHHACAGYGRLRGGAARAAAPRACGMAQASDYDLVILDLIMPDIDGRTRPGPGAAGTPRAGRPGAVLPRRRDHQGGLPGTGRAGLPDQALLPGRTAGPGAGPAARGAAPAPTRCSRPGTCSWTWAGWRPTSATGRSPLTRLEFLLLRELMEHAGPVGGQGPAAGRRSGATTSTPAPTWWTSVSGGSGPSWASS